MSNEGLFFGDIVDANIQRTIRDFSVEQGSEEWTFTAVSAEVTAARPVPRDEALRIVARGKKQDGPEGA